MFEEVADSAWLLAASPATPIFNAPYKLILHFLQGGLAVFDRARLRFDAASRRRCFKTSNQFATAAMSAMSISMLPMIRRGVPPVMSIWVTVPALATLLATVPPARSVAVTVSL